MPPDTADAASNADAIFTQLFLTAGGRANPYPLYHQLRAGRAGASRQAGDVGAQPLRRLLGGHARSAPRQGLRAADRAALRPRLAQHPSLTAGEHSMLNTTGPEHTRLRKLVTKSFTPRMIENLKPVIERVVNQLLDPVAEAGGGNVLEAVGFPLPVTIIGEMLGVPEADRPQFRGLVRDLVAIFEMQPTAEQMAAADAAQLVIRAYFLKLIAEKRRQPGEDLLSNLATAEVGGDRLSDDELVTLASLLFAAGFETTTNLFGNGLLALLRHPDQLALLRRDASLFANLPDEFLRYDGTAQLANRVTEASVEVGGVTIPAGEQVFALLGAGNHDPARFPNPDRLDVTRTDDPAADLRRRRALLPRRRPGAGGDRDHVPHPAAALRSHRAGRRRAALPGSADAARPHRPQRRVPQLVDVRAPASADAALPRRRSPPQAPAPSMPSAGCGRGRATATPTCAGAPSCANASRPSRRVRIRYRCAPERAWRPRSGCCRATACSRAAPTQELEQLAATAYPMSFEPGDMLCAEGGESPECYIIEEGQAVVTIGRKGVGRSASTTWSASVACCSTRCAPPR